VSTEHQDEQPLEFDEVEQLERFQRRLDVIKVDRRQALMIFGAVGGAAGLAACGSSNNKNNSNNNAAKPSASAAASSAASAAASSAATKAATAAAGGSPAAGGTPAAFVGPQKPPASVKVAATQNFRYAIDQEPSSFDFNKDLYCNGDAAVFAQLCQFSTDLQPVPDIATSWEPSQGGAVWTFHLRNDSKWSDGSPVTAMDYDYSYRRQMNPATKAPYASFLYDIKNAQAYNTGKLPDDSTLGIKVIDPQTIQFTLEAPAAYWPALMAYAAAAPANKGAVDKFGDKWTEAANIVCNGPFKLTTWDHDKQIVMTRNDGYWNAKNISLNTVTRPIIAPDSQVQAFDAGQIDWVSRVGPADYTRYTGDATLSKQVIKYFLDGTWYLVPEADKKPFDTLQVRQAMAHAIDRDAIVKNVLKGLGQSAYTFIPPGTPGFNPNKYDANTSFNPQMAKDLLKGTPYEGGKNWPPITLTQRTESDNEKNAGDAIIQMLGDNLGMTNIQHEVGDSKDVYNRMYQRKLQLIWIRWYEDYPDQNDEQNLVFWSKAGGDSGHRQAWHDDQYDQIIVAAKSETDPQKRTQMYYQADQILAQQAGAIFVYYPQNAGVLKPNIGGMPKDSNGNYTPAWNIFVRMYDYLYQTA
jgi:ABC-type oligopeptide transport system substrate-binding subunit